MTFRHVVESPIEVLMLAELYRMFRVPGPLAISTQRTVKTPGGVFRLDIALEYESKRIGIECDGHEWHGTREQRLRDAARDFALEYVGWKIVRFTGSEIRRDAHECAIRAGLALFTLPPPAKWTLAGSAQLAKADP